MLPAAFSSLTRVRAEQASIETGNDEQKRREGVCTPREVYGMDMQSTGAFATLDAYCTAASELSSAFAVHLFSWLIVTVLFLFVPSLPLIDDC